MNARSALFDVYGDHLVGRGGQAPVASLVKLLAPLGVAPPAVRTAISRMVRQGWLAHVDTGQGPGYALTPRAVRRLEEAGSRIYRTRESSWDGRWHLLVVGRTSDRTVRDRLKAGLTFLGYGCVDDTTWIAPRPSLEVDALLDAEGIRAERFTAQHDGDTAALVSRVWDLEALGRAYRRWAEDAALIVDAAGPDPTDEAAFGARSRLLHEWRKFLFRDPALPPELLPADWAGTKAASYFDAESARLLSGAVRYVDACLATAHG